MQVGFYSAFQFHCFALRCSDEYCTARALEDEIIKKFLLGCNGARVVAVVAVQKSHKIHGNALQKEEGIALAVFQTDLWTIQAASRSHDVRLFSIHFFSSIGETGSYCCYSQWPRWGKESHKMHWNALMQKYPPPFLH